MAHDLLTHITLEPVLSTDGLRAKNEWRSSFDWVESLWAVLLSHTRDTQRERDKYGEREKERVKERERQRHKERERGREREATWNKQQGQVQRQ